MPTIVDRDGCVRLLSEEFAAVTEMCEGFSDADWETPTCLPGWTVKDQLSHMSGTERMLLGDAAPVIQVPDADWLRNDIGRANETWVEANRALSGYEVMAQWIEVTVRRLEALGAMTQADFDAPSWTPAGRDETYGRFMRIRHFDCFMHEHDIRPAVGLPDRPDPTHVQSCLDEIATGIGYIVGRRAGFPPGSSCRIEVSGQVRATYLVAVGERAALVDSLPDGPTVTMSLPVMLWLRLTGGRVDPVPHIGTDLELQGDEELGRQLATHLAFTI